MHYKTVLKQCLVIGAVCLIDQMVHGIPVGNETGKDTPAPNDEKVHSSMMNSLLPRPNLIGHKLDSPTRNEYGPIVIPNYGNSRSAVAASAIPGTNTTQSTPMTNSTLTSTPASNNTSPDKGKDGEKSAGANSTSAIPAPNTNTSTNLFPTYEEFRGESHEGSVDPFLAVTDTFFSADSQRAYGPAPYETRYQALGDLEGTFDIVKHWGVLSPYFSSPIFKDLQSYRSIPNKCTIKQVNMLHRHGARMPKHDQHESAPMFEIWFKNVTSDDPKVNGGQKATFSGPLTFLSKWTYALGADNLAPAGFQQLYDSGIYMHYRYGPLFKNNPNSTAKPIIRTTSQKRMVDSAHFWALGFLGTNASALADIEIQIEKSGFNTTLAAQEACPGTKTDLAGSMLKAEWIKKYLAKAIERLQHHVHGAKLTAEVVFDMQSLCPYETYSLGLSEFCNLFTREEWDGFEYAHDLVFQGDFGYMSKTGRAQGIGWAQELVARMKGGNISTPLTSQNTTWDQNPSTFPLNQSFYADFSHGRQVVSVLTALNYNIFDSNLDPLKPDENRSFIVSHIAPSAARIVFEVLQCDESSVANSGDGKRQYVRTFLNDALLPMSHEQGCVGHDSMRDGLCPLDKFIEHFEQVSVPAANYQQACFNTEHPANEKSNSTTNVEDESSDDDATRLTALSTNKTEDESKHPKKEGKQAPFKLP